ncbi:hypothetical protein BOX15_Mlig015208g1, partial [Macrostomum lignano]
PAIYPTATWNNKVNSFVLENKQTLLKSAVILCVLTALVLLFFVAKSVMLRRRASKSRRYGLVDADKLEMQRLDEDDADDEVTVFDANGGGGGGRLGRSLVRN